MPTRLVNTCEQGADGSSPSVAANNGRRSGNGWNGVAGTVTTTIAQFAHGTKSLKLDITNGAPTTQGVTWTETSFTLSPTTQYSRFYFRLESLPASSHRWVTFASSGGSTYLGGLLLRPDGKIDLADASTTGQTTSTTTLSLNQWYRIETQLDSHATTGAMTVKIFAGGNLEGASADETLSYTNKNTNGAAIRWLNIGGTNVGASYGMWIDSIEANDYQFPGPFAPPIPSQYQTLFANGTYPFWAPADTTLVDNTTYSMGMYFTPNVNGKVYGGAWFDNLRLTSADSGVTPQIALYPGPAGGTSVIASKVTTNTEVRGNWNYDLFNTPIDVVAGTTYMIVVLHRNYTAETNYFDPQNGGVVDQVQGNLTAPGRDTTNNNFFTAGASLAKPSTNFSSPWYGLDVLFMADVVNTTSEFWGVPY